MNIANEFTIRRAGNDGYTVTNRNDGGKLPEVAAFSNAVDLLAWLTGQLIPAQSIPEAVKYDPAAGDVLVQS